MKSQIQLAEMQEPEVTHTFSDGVYARTIHMKAGCYIVGAVHNTDHLNIIQTGRCMVDTGDGWEQMDSPLMFESKAGVQKALYIQEDVDWTTIHATDVTDIDELESILVMGREESLDYFIKNGGNTQCLFGYQEQL